MDLVQIVSAFSHVLYRDIRCSKLLQPFSDGECFKNLPKNADQIRINHTLFGIDRNYWIVIHHSFSTKFHSNRFVKRFLIHWFWNTTALSRKCWLLYMATQTRTMNRYIET